jgi:hypothetical protein
MPTARNAPTTRTTTRAPDVADALDLQETDEKEHVSNIRIYRQNSQTSPSTRRRRVVLGGEANCIRCSMIKQIEPTIEERPPASSPQKRYIPVANWNDYHDWPPPGGLRHLIFHAASNGFEAAFKRVGRRVLVDEMEFFRCIERNQQSQS